MLLPEICLRVVTWSLIMMGPELRNPYVPHTYPIKPKGCQEPYLRDHATTFRLGGQSFISPNYGIIRRKLYEDPTYRACLAFELQYLYTDIP